MGVTRHRGPARPPPRADASAAGRGLRRRAAAGGTAQRSGRHGPAFARPGLPSLLAALLGLCARFTAAPGTAVPCWLFLNGFAVPPAGILTWAGHRGKSRYMATWLFSMRPAVPVYWRWTPTVARSEGEPEQH
ncbi:putative integral membrane protein [Streptomyces azureus]|uniref:Putative integral membrane protein n=1 Tax=Streptomyces azureus TaxID=146537 RepID=A0A0K8PIB4_STRAJ|nr:putative integral membrane protein [Streptomyces azureus]